MRRDSHVLQWDPEKLCKGIRQCAVVRVCGYGKRLIRGIVRISNYNLF